MNRRGFLGSILAAGVAPFVMSNAVGRGILMPVKELWTPAIDATALDPLAGGILKLYTGTGALLAEMPMKNMALGAPRSSPQGIESVMAGDGMVQATGTVRYSRIKLNGIPETDIDVTFGSPYILEGDMLSLQNVRLTLDD